MQILPLSARTRILTFDDGISVLLILGTRNNILCDTHLGPDSMDKVRTYLTSSQSDPELVIFNSHSDWDHIWGNCAFPDAWIIAHTRCRERMIERGRFDLNRLASHCRGQVTLKLPNLTFEDRLCLDDEGVEFIAAPGHTIDSALCFDGQDMVLYVGDLVEDPIPYLDYDNLDEYISTLRTLAAFPATIMVSAHSGVVSRDLIQSNIRYIQAVQRGASIDTETLGAYRAVHQCNLNTLLMFSYEKKVRTLMGNQFNFESFWSIPPDLDTLRTDELEEKIIKFLSCVTNGLPGHQDG
ncbi:MAG TPA: MBL fold metallo-hydrolase [Methanospirillum sp.]|nr:MBL fold metallo-hydrolase [Methanospirillum sp.]